MKAKFQLISAILMTLFFSSNCMAGIYADDMSRCLVSSATAKDKTDLVRWIFGIIAAHPEVASMSTIKDKQRDELNRTAGLLLQRLMTEDCKKQTADAYRYEGGSAIQASFGVLGKVAMQELMTNPSVAKSATDVAKYVDESKFKMLLKPEDEGSLQKPTEDKPSRDDK